MTDRELLELAAKAVGKNLAKYEWHPSGAFFRALGDASDYWTPLTDDGDALRLAVKLRLTLLLELPRIGIGPRMDFPEVWVDEGEDENEATRRAIVRAAAEIGKAM